ncbi:G1/S-specific cyclin CCN1, partial [Fusarium oxysporum f. sp. albedinis]
MDYPRRHRKAVYTNAYCRYVFKLPVNSNIGNKESIRLAVRNHVVDVPGFSDSMCKTKLTSFRTSLWSLPGYRPAQAMLSLAKVMIDDQRIDLPLFILSSASCFRKSLWSQQGYRPVQALLSLMTIGPTVDVESASSEVLNFDCIFRATYPKKGQFGPSGKRRTKGAVVYECLLCSSDQAWSNPKRDNAIYHAKR